MIKRYAKKESKSFFFYDDVLSLLERNQYDYIDLSIVHELIKFGRINLFAEQRVPLQHYDLVTKIIDQINCVMNTIIPGLQISIEDEEEVKPGGRKYKKIRFLEHRANDTFSLEYESAGIKRIISIMSVLVAMVNNPAVCLVVDEFDSGVFEYLLGQLLQVIDTSAKGQFIFTSHNLHALEGLPKEKIIFSTADPKNRYTTLKGLGNSNNLRDVYLKAVFLGTKEKELYASTDITAIKRAFRKAGRLYGKYAYNYRTPI